MIQNDREYASEFRRWQVCNQHQNREFRERIYEPVIRTNMFPALRNGRLKIEESVLSHFKKGGYTIHESVLVTAIKYNHRWYRRND